MSMESDLQAWLLAQAGVSSVIETRLFRLVADQDAATPYAVMQTTSNDPQRSLDGPTGEAVSRLQIACWGDSAAQAEQVIAAVRTSLRALEAAIVAARQPALVGTTRVRDVSDGSNQETYEDAVREPSRIIEFTVRYEE